MEQHLAGMYSVICGLWCLDLVICVSKERVYTELSLFISLHSVNEQLVLRSTSISCVLVLTTFLLPLATIYGRVVNIHHDFHMFYSLVSHLILFQYIKLCEMKKKNDNDIDSKC